MVTIPDVIAYIKSTYGDFSCPNLYYDRDNAPETLLDGIHLSRKAADTIANPEMAVYEFCHEIWHWFYEDYKEDITDYPRDTNGRYVFGKNNKWDEIEGRSCVGTEELFLRFNLPSNIADHDNYKKALDYYIL